MDRVKQKVWVTKYALSKGVFTVEAEIVQTSSGKPFATWKTKGFMQFAHGQEFHLTEEAAEACFEVMVLKKIKSLQAQVKRVSGLRFGVTAE